MDDEKREGLAIPRSHLEIIVDSNYKGENVSKGEKTFCTDYHSRYDSKTTTFDDEKFPTAALVIFRRKK
jgi:hypothetical protein